jgi:hypothetical protein
VPDAAPVLEANMIGPIGTRCRESLQARAVNRTDTRLVAAG